jgi:hypothetical protein
MVAVSWKPRCRIVGQQEPTCLICQVVDAGGGLLVKEPHVHCEQFGDLGELMHLQVTQMPMCWYQRRMPCLPFFPSAFLAHLQSDPPFPATIPPASPHSFIYRHL